MKPVPGAAGTNAGRVETSAREDLEARLRRPDRGERGYRETESFSRLDAVAELGRRLSTGEISLDEAGARSPGGINTHVHTGKSFGVLASPSEAAWRAKLEGLRLLGINDHWTIAGHDEFRAACAAVSIAASFSMELIAMWDEPTRAGLPVNDPTNPGRTYLTAKGVTRPFRDGAPGTRDIESCRRSLLTRHREMSERLAAHVEATLGWRDAFRFEDVLALTPHGEPTERHIAARLSALLRERAPEPAERAAAVERLTGSSVDVSLDDASLDDEPRVDDLLRARLLKVGKPAFVPEASDAFPSFERFVSIALELGSIPTYPVLGDPVTPWEEDLERLYDRLEEKGIRALEVIPDRNRAERLLEIVERAEARGLPVVNGTEHNTRSRPPLVDRWFFDARFRPHFERGARVLLGHQALVARGEPGFVDSSGELVGGSPKDAIARAAAIGDGLLSPWSGA